MFRAFEKSFPLRHHMDAISRLESERAIAIELQFVFLFRSGWQTSDGEAGLIGRRDIKARAIINESVNGILHAARSDN
jgi:hypothetical protein